MPSCTTSEFFNVFNRVTLGNPSSRSNTSCHSTLWLRPERRPHLAGALGAALLSMALKRKWVLQDLDGRALEVTSLGRREMSKRLGLQT
jgi:hypothetical protein